MMTAEAPGTAVRAAEIRPPVQDSAVPMRAPRERAVVMTVSASDYPSVE
jgi:hypothetical protein